jgi:hypothetical protein
MNSLHTWKLTPTTTPSALWYLSAARSPVRVRAAGPLEARELATRIFCKRDSTPTSSSPWLDPDLVHCAEEHDERLNTITEPGIVPDE